MMSGWNLWHKAQTGMRAMLFVVGFLIGCQFPVFVSHYQQRLSGHVAELNRLVVQLQQLAAQSGKSWEQYLSKFLASSDADFRSHGEWMGAIADRAMRLSQELQHLAQAPFWTKWYYFGVEGEWEMVRGTWENFSPGIVFSWEGLFYSALGASMGWMLGVLLTGRRRHYVGVA